MCRRGSLRQTDPWLLVMYMHLTCTPPFSVQVLHRNNSQLRNKRASQHQRFMCCEIDCMRWLMLRSVAAVWMETWRRCLKRQFKGFWRVTVFISFVSLIILLWSPQMDVFGFSPVISYTLMIGESMETMLVVLEAKEGGGGGVISLPYCLPGKSAAKTSTHPDRKDWRGNCRPRVYCDRYTVFVCIHSSWLQVEPNICCLVKMNRTESYSCHHFPRKVLVSHLLIAWRVIYIYIFFLPQNESTFFPSYCVSYIQFQRQCWVVAQHLGLWRCNIALKHRS